MASGVASLSGNYSG